MLKKRNLVNQFIYKNKLLESNFFNLKQYNFFFKRCNDYFGLYDYKIVFIILKRLLFILENIKKKDGLILFIGLNKEDYPDYIVFNKILKKLAVSQGHIYADSNFKGFLYNRWSLYKRRSNPSDFFLKLQENNKFPCVLFSFSKSTDNVIYKEFSKFGIPIIYILEGYSHFEFKDYPLIGSYSREMLNFYLNLLQYCLN